MALLQLIFDKPKKAAFEISQNNEKVVVELDASINENHQRSTIITENEIEDGADINDHAKLAPKKFTFEAMFSDAPISFLGALAGTAISSASQLANNALGGGAAGNLGGLAAGLGLGSVAKLLTNNRGPNGEILRDPEDAFRFLEKLWQDRQPFSMQTALTNYENMLIEDLSVPRSAKNGKSLRFTMTLKEVRIAESAVVKVPLFKVDNEGASSNASLGRQAAKNAADGTTQKSSSILFRLGQKAGVL